MCDPAKKAGQAANEDAHSCFFVWAIKNIFFKLWQEMSVFSKDYQV